MHKLLAGLALMAALSAPAFAQMEVKEIKVDQSKGTAKTRFQVQMVNPGTEVVHLSRVVLRVREKPSVEWRTLNIFSVDAAVDPKKSLNLSYKVKPDHGKVDPALSQKTFQVQAVADGAVGPLVIYTHP